MTDVFADVWCPFAHVGIRRFVERRRALGRRDLLLRVRAWPLELVNGHGLDAGHVAEDIEELRHRVAPDLFGGFDARTFPRTTLPALDLVEDAYRTGMWVGERASIALRDALFERGQDISDARVLATLRTDLGIRRRDERTRAHVLAGWEEGRRRGVIGSPHFFVDGHDFFCPALRIEGAGEHRRIELDAHRFDEFFEECAAA